MRRLLQNLISNALKYTLSGRVLIGCRRLPGAARIEVWDTGLGIPPELQRAVFGEFQRLDQGARVARGLGLGLSIVERLGRVLDHPVGLRSWPSKGSVFSVTAPLGRAAPETRGEPGAARARWGGRPAQRTEGSSHRQRTARARRPAPSPESMGLRGCDRPRPRRGESRPRRNGRAGRHHRRLPPRFGDGVAAIKTLRGDLGRNVPAMLATADRSPEVRAEAARADVLVMNKPLKPAPLRAQLTRFSAMREAAE